MSRPTIFHSRSLVNVEKGSRLDPAKPRECRNSGRRVAVFDTRNPAYKRA